MEAFGFTQMAGRVAVLAAQGLSVGQIAAARSCQESTIRSHEKHMFAGYGLSRQTEAVRPVQSVTASARA